MDRATLDKHLDDLAFMYERNMRGPNPAGFPYGAARSMAERSVGIYVLRQSLDRDAQVDLAISILEPFRLRLEAV